MTICPPPCGKTRFHSKHKAQLACIRAAMTDNPRLVWYHSGPCHCWHLTSSRHGRTRRRQAAWIQSFAGDDDKAS